MNSEDRLLDLLTRWEEERGQGRDLAPQELAPGEAELWGELDRRITRRRLLPRLLGCDDAADRPPATLPRVAGYEVLEEVGQGGQAVVYRARQQLPRRTVALKMILRPNRRLRTEIDAAARLQHLNIVQIFEVGQHEGRPFLTLEYLAGGSLAQKLKPARAVHHAHQQGVVHRDLKPANILLVGEGEGGMGKADGPGVTASCCVSLPIPHTPFPVPKVTDFGLAKVLADDCPEAVGTQTTATGDFLGTPSYMAPEQAEGRSKQVGPAADVYALGAVLYECLTGQPPFRGASWLETLEKVRSQDPVPVRRLRRNVPRDLERICDVCLRKAPG
jgi:serine/threonine protein kinase